MIHITTKTTAKLDYATFDLNSDDLTIQTFFSNSTDHDDEILNFIKDDDFHAIYIDIDCIEALKTTIEGEVFSEVTEVSKSTHRKFLSLRDKFVEAIKMIDSLTVSDD